MKRKNNKKSKLLSLLFIVLFVFISQTIVYSAINSTMKITGDAYARAEADVRITDFRLATTNKATSSYEEFGKSHTVTEVDLTDTSSSITYYIEITNYGSTDIGIFDITGLPSGVNYSIKDYKLHDKICDDSGKCNSFIKKTYEVTLTTTSTYSGNVQMNFDFRTYHKVTYIDINNNGYPVDVIDGGNLNITFTEDLKRVQVLSNNSEIAFYKQISNGQSVTINNIFSDVEVKIKPQVARLKNGDLNKIGSEVCIEDECFYIISNDGSTVTMLAKHNLYIGGEYNNNVWTSYGDEATGLQNSAMIGWVSEGQPFKGTIEFSNDIYKGTNYSDYSGSLVETYVNNYKIKLEDTGVFIQNSRLITYDELTNQNTFACEEYDYCSDEYPWIYSTSYWSGSAVEANKIMVIRNDAMFRSVDYNKNTLVGVRPVIEIDVNEIFVPVARLVSGNLGDIGSEVCIKNECFNTISSDTENITMLAKYNLYVGGLYDREYKIYGNEATGLQDSTMLGFTTNGYPYKGVTAFSSDDIKGANYSDYSGSIVEGYVNNYKKMLENFNIEINDSRLITKNEIISLGCTGQTCDSNNSWIYNTTFWTSTSRDNQYIYILGSNQQIDYVLYRNYINFGVRPVITIAKKNIRESINFTVNGVVYNFEEGMTWEEWCSSKYNTDGYTVGEGNLVIAPTGHSFGVYGIDIIEHTAYSYNINVPPAY